ncbi:hypothetical protein Aperf_G00000125690 [Anoplocephala perfoliata]
MNKGDSHERRTKTTKRDLMNQSLRLAGYTFILQILLRIITFVTNAFAYRCVDASIVGLVNFRIGLYYSTLVFTARESFRRACLSRGGEILLSPSTSDIRSKWRALLNIMWLTVPVGILLSFGLLPIWLFLLSSPASDSSSSVIVHQYVVSCLLYTLSAYLELATEPLWLVCQLGMFVRARIALEAIANIARALGIIFALWIGDGSTNGLYLLACPQILHGSTLFLGYFLFSVWLVKYSSLDVAHPFIHITPKSLRDLLPSIHSSFDWSCLVLSWNFFRQGLLKQFLTEGERYLISAFHLLNFAEQGVYDLVTNLGSMVPRLIFSSIEESCHLLFSQCIQRDVSPKYQNETYLREAVKLLRTSLRLLTLIAWIGCVFAQAYSNLLLYLYGGLRFITDNPAAVNLLRIFALYLVFLAWNGPTEAFLNAAMTTTDVSRHNFRLTAFSVIFLGAAWFLVSLCGAAGFILANCVNIASRVFYSCYFIGNFVDQVKENRDLSIVGKKELEDFSFPHLMLPSKLQAVLMLTTLVVTLISEHLLGSVLTFARITLHIAVGAAAFLVVAVSSRTKLKIIPLDGIPASLSLKSPPDFSSKSLPIGLESTWNSVVGFVRQFSLSLDFLSKSGEPTGLLLYGLQGCGKSCILEKLSNVKTMGSDVSTTLMKHQAWYERLQFCTLSIDSFSTSEMNMVSFRKYITSTLIDIPKSSSGIVLSIPNLDTWPTLIHEPDAPHLEDPHDPQEFANRNSGLYSFLFSALKLTCSTLPVCVLATSTESTNILKHRDLRNLFYRKLLVSLPNGEQRYRFLSQEIKSFLSSCSKTISSDDIDRLRQLAASLHGYSLTDISRLLRAGYAAATDDCTNQYVKYEDGDLHHLPAIHQIVDKLESEKVHYRPANLLAEISVFPPMRWSDIGGYSEIKHLFTSTIQRRLLEAADPTSEAARINKALGLSVPRGVLLHGPPGCSKTLFVRALATECNLPLVAVQASRIFGRYVGDSERNMQRILVHARACSPAILFIDEIDLLLPSRSSSESGVSEHVLGEVLTVMDGVEGQCGQLLLIAATNRLENLDPALRRAGRFDMVIHIPPPDAEARKAILQLELSKRSTSAHVLDSDWLAAFAKSHLEGYTGAEVVGVVQTAAELTRDSQCVQIDREHLLLACERLPPTTLEQYHTHLLRNTSTSQKPSSSSSINSFPHLSSRSFLIISCIIILVFAVEWQLVTHLGLGD